MRQEVEWLDVFVRFARNPLQRDDGVAEIWEAVEQLSALEDLAPDLIMRSGRMAKLSRERVEAELAAARRKRRAEEVELRRSTPPDVRFRWVAIRDNLRFHAALPLSAFTGSAGERRAAALVRYLELTDRFDFDHGWAHPRADVELSNERSHVSVKPKVELPEVFWLTVIGRRLARKLHKARVESTPGVELMRLESGYLLLAGETPGDALARPGRERQASARTHLVPDTNFEDELGRLLERSGRLEPVVRDWDPDLAELLDHAIYWTQLEDRRERELAFNDLRPAPAGAQFDPSGVDRSRGGVEAFASHCAVLADGFEIGFHSKIKQLMGGGLDSVVELDKFFWREDYSRRDADLVRERLVPGLGAWIGHTLVAEFGAEWMPGEALHDARVVVHDTAFSPFFRAEQYYRSKDAVLEHSMTKLYREAARAHARSTPPRGET